MTHPDPEIAACTAVASIVWLRPEADIQFEGPRVPVQMNCLREMPAAVHILSGEPWDPIEKLAQTANRRD